MHKKLLPCKGIQKYKYAVEYDLPPPRLASRTPKTIKNY